jgi:iron(III) transport system ATP-binding protein
LLRVNNISFNYPAQSLFIGLNRISFTLTPGTILAVIGASGCGKTTLLKCIYGLVDLSEGDVTINGNPVLGPANCLMPGNPDMKLVSQDYYVLDNHTVTENISDVLSGYNDEYKRTRGRKLLKLLQLEPLAAVACRNLSSGQRQRVAIARALAVMPAVLLLDEPFSNLDLVLTERIFSFIRKEVRSKKTAVIMVTHHPEDALKHATEVAILDKGRLVQQGQMQKVYYKPKNLHVARLMGAFNTIAATDLETSSRFAGRKKIYFRPDKLSAAASPAADLKLTVINTSFNGKCYELLAETGSGSPLIVYSDKQVAAGEVINYRILD